MIFKDIIVFFAKRSVYRPHPVQCAYTILYFFVPTLVKNMKLEMDVYGHGNGQQHCFDLWYTVQVITNFYIITAKYASPVLSSLCQYPCQCKCPCHCFMSMSVLHVMLHIHVHVHSVCPCRCFLSMVYVHNYAECWCRCSMSILHVKLSMSVMNVHVHAASPWQCCMSMSLLRVHVHAACPCPFATCP
jgi:hypothetical protein